MKPKLITCYVAALALGGVAAFNASASLVDLGPGSFTPAASVITFSEFTLGTINPSATLAAGSLGNVTVSFAASFEGQTITGGYPKTLSGSPNDPLALDFLTGGITFTENDGASDSNPVLSGDPTFNGPISVLFSTPVAAVGLKAGYFDNPNSTTIEAFDSNGNSLGSIVNSVKGFEFYGLADSGGANVISGISFYITGNEPAGFAIDNLTFGAREVVNTPDGGSTLLLLSSVLGGLGLVRTRKH